MAHQSGVPVSAVTAKRTLTLYKEGANIAAPLLIILFFLRFCVCVSAVTAENTLPPYKEGANVICRHSSTFSLDKNLCVQSLWGHASLDAAYHEPKTPYIYLKIRRKILVLRLMLKLRNNNGFYITAVYYTI